MDRLDISPELVARLVGEQFRELAHLPVTPVDLNGWDNSTFRLGDELSVRLPSAEGYVAQIDKEHRWLPVLRPQLPLPIPEPVAMGRPGSGYPFPWSIYRWIDGEPASIDRVDDLAGFARDVAGFIRSLHEIDAADGPPPGAHNFHRGGSLAVYDAEARESIELLAGEIDAAAATAVWQEALRSTWNLPPVWVHGDVSASNLLVADGRLSAVIDFGSSAVGDPACDLVMAWTFFSDEARDRFRRGIPLDEATWARGRGWTLWKALITVVDERRTRSDPADAVRRFGWRSDARRVIDEVLATKGHQHDGTVM